MDAPRGNDFLFAPLGAGSQALSVCALSLDLWTAATDSSHELETCPLAERPTVRPQTPWPVHSMVNKKTGKVLPMHARVR